MSPVQEKKKVKVVRVVDGHEVEEWIEIDAAGETAWPDRDRLALLNTPMRRVDGPDKVSGRAQYTHDVRLPGMLWAKLLCCPRPAARVAMEFGPALDMDGVADIVPLLPETGETSFLGQPVAAVAAISAEIAEEAVRAIEVRYEDLGWVVDREHALAPEAPQVTRRGNAIRARESGDLGRAREALESSDVVIEAAYSLPVQHHCCLETHGSVVDYRGGDEATVYCSTQNTHGQAASIAEVLEIPVENVRVIVQHMGGGFGSKFGLGVEGRAACMLAKRLQRPVHLMLGRTEEFLMAGNRSGSHQELTGGVTADGTFKAFVGRVDKLGGVGGGSYPGERPYIYKVEHAHVHTQSVMTNTDAGRAMRAPGHPQGSFGIESLVDELAYSIGMDPLDFRMKNLEDPVYHRQLDRAAREVGWYDHPFRNEPGPATQKTAVGIGFGVSTWNGGGRPVCEVEVKIDSTGAVSASVGSQDLGTGTRTYVAGITAEILGLPLDAVTARIGDNALGMANGSGGSTTTPSLAPAVLDAAHKAKAALFERVAPSMEVDPALLAARGGEIVDQSDESRKLSWAAACATLGATPVVAHGTWQAGLSGNGIRGAQAAKVEVDTETGAFRVVKMAAIHDTGLPLNRLALESQIRGGVIQALSYGLFEERIIDPWLGSMLSANFDAYHIAGCKEIPEIVAIIDDEDDRQQVIGSAEAHIIPGHSAIANAIHNACGVRLRSLPLSPTKLLEGLLAKRA